MSKDITTKIRSFVEAECKKPTSTYGYEPFHDHFEPTVYYARKLARELGGDIEVVTIAGWMHDIGAIIKRRGEHHITGAKIAVKKLEELNYPKDRVELVGKCILNHRGSTQRKQESLEEKIIVDADAMSNFENLSGIFKAAFIYEKLSQKEAQASVRKKLQNKWKQLNFQNSRDIIRPKYKAAMLLLK